jgi:hypothetical protein
MTTARAAAVAAIATAEAVAVIAVAIEAAAVPRAVEIEVQGATAAKQVTSHNSFNKKAQALLVPGLFLPASGFFVAWASRPCWRVRSKEGADIARAILIYFTLIAPCMGGTPMPQRLTDSC